MLIDTIRCIGRLTVMAGVIVMAASWPSLGQGVSLTLDEAIDRALHHTARGGMIRGNEEVARQLYSARRTNLYVPEISINGSLPAYTKSKNYRQFGGAFDRRLFETTDLDFNSYIELDQSLITGGTLTATANLTRKDFRYPLELSDGTYFLDEYTRQGYFNFTLDQPLFRPSQVKNDLNNRRDDLTIAQMTHIEENTALRKEVVAAYLSVLQAQVKQEKADCAFRRATAKTLIDSAKLADGVLSEEDYLLSMSERLDAELALFEIQSETDEQQRELAMLLDMAIETPLTVSEPTLGATIDSVRAVRMLAAWETTVPVLKAERQYEKAKREANFSASGHRLTGDLKATYSFGRGNVEKELASVAYDDQDINTSGWSISLNFRLPVWDGGAGSAAIRASEYQAEQARYEFTRAQRSARAQVANLLNQIDVSRQRLDIKRQQTELAANRLRIAEGRYADGRISELTLLEVRVSYLDSRTAYLEELKTYLMNKIELEGKFVG
jgi:outer membrane protein TolC